VSRRAGNDIKPEHPEVALLVDSLVDLGLVLIVVVVVVVVVIVVVVVFHQFLYFS
jgi:hypothetical protein